MKRLFREISVAVMILTAIFSGTYAVKATNYENNSDLLDKGSITVSYADSKVMEFSDIEESFWAYEAIMNLAKRGIIEGYSDGTFRPNASVTRSEFAAMFTKALNLKADNTKQTFADVSLSNWDYNVIEAAKTYMTGYKSNDGLLYFFGSKNAVREDMAVALVKALKLQLESNNAKLQELFIDYNSISSDLRDYIYTAYKNGIMIGDKDKICPQDTLTRAQAAALIDRTLLKSESAAEKDSQKIVVDKESENSDDTDNSDIVTNELGIRTIWVNGHFLNGFRQDKYSYTVEFQKGTTKIPVVSASSFNDESIIKIQQTDKLPGRAMIVVTSADYTYTKTYIISFDINDDDDTDTTLSNLIIDGVTVSDFEPEDRIYKVNVPAGTTKVPTVQAVVNDIGKASAVVVPAEDLPGVTTVIVTAEDPTVTGIYTIIFKVN